MQADAPAVAAQIDSELRGWLEHNELELALDELLAGAYDSKAVLRSGFWNDLLTAAMLMGLKRQFLKIAARIPLGPHPFGAHESLPHIYCDMNGFIEKDVYCLDGVGTALDFARLNFLPAPEQDVVLYEYDQEEDGAPSWLLANAHLTEHPPWGLVAKVDPSSYRWQRR